jgi:hypothetical protein
MIARLCDPILGPVDPHSQFNFVETAMNLNRLYFVAVTIDVLLSLFPEIFGLGLLSLKPSSYLSYSSELEPIIPEKIFRIIAGIASIELLIAYLALYRQWKSARIIAWSISLFLMSVGPVEPSTHFGSIIHSMIGVSGGFLVCLMYFSPLSERFTKIETNNQ